MYIYNKYIIYYIYSQIYNKHIQDNTTLEQLKKFDIAPGWLASARLLFTAVGPRDHEYDPAR